MNDHRFHHSRIRDLLQHHKELLRCLPRYRLIYVSDRPWNFSKAELRFERFADWSLEELQDLPIYFDLEHRMRTGEGVSLTIPQLDLLRGMRKRLGKYAQVERWYQRWANDGRHPRRVRPVLSLRNLSAGGEL